MAWWVVIGLGRVPWSLFDDHLAHSVFEMHTLVRGRAASRAQQAEPCLVDSGNTGVTVLFPCMGDYFSVAVFDSALNL